MVGYNKYLKSRYSFSMYVLKRNYLGPVLLASLFLPVPFHLFSDSFFSLLRCIRSYYACTLYVCDAPRGKEKGRESHQLPLRFSLSIVDIAFIHFHSVLVLKRSREREERNRRRKKRADVEEVRGNEAKSELKKADRPQLLS